MAQYPTTQLGPETMQRWIEIAAESDEFWRSRPRWRSDVARIDHSSGSVVWGQAGLFDLEPIGLAVSAHFDGELSLAQLADDLAAAAEAPIEVARSVVASLAIELTSLAAIEGVDSSAPPSRAGGAAVRVSAPTVARRPNVVGESIRLDSGTGEEIRVVTEAGPNGALVTTEYLPNGRRRMYGSVTFSTDQIDQAATAAEVLAGDRSAAELVPADTCLGFKLRNDESVALVSRRGPDGRVRSVRCHDAEVAEVLRSRFGAVNESVERGPIEAFVVTPLEGCGPVRIYDGVGRRRGRPRSSADAAAVVDQILGERETASVAGVELPGAPLPLPLVLVGGPDGVDHLVPLDSLRGVGLVNRLVSSGYRPTFGRAVLSDDGVVTSPGSFTDSLVRSRSVRIHVGIDAVGDANRLALLLGATTPPGGDEAERTVLAAWRRHVMATAFDLARVDWATMTSPLDIHLGIER